MNHDLLNVKRYVGGIRRKIIALRAIKGISIALSAFFLSSFVLNVAFALFPWILLPLVWDIFLVVGCVFIPVWIIDSFFIHAPSLLDISKIIENRNKNTHPLLSIALELEKGVQNSLTDQAYKLASEQISTFSSPVFLQLHYMVIFPAAFVVWAISYMYIKPALSEYWKMPLSFLNKSEAQIFPGSIKIPQNTNISLRLLPLQSKFPSCHITVFSLESQKRYRRLLRPDSSGTFSMSLDSVHESLIYQFSYGGKNYRSDTVKVIAPPVLYSLQVDVFPPKYTRSPAKELPEGQGDFTAYAGTKTKFQIESDFLANAWIIMGKDSTLLQVEGNRAEGEFSVWKQLEYTFALQDSFGQSNDSLPRFHIGIIPDEPPIVHFIKPGINKSLTPALIETLWVEGIDDLGIRSIQLLFCKNDQCDSSSVWDISPKGTPRTSRKQLIWNLKKFSLYPGDTLFYWASVRDSWPFKPARTVYSDTFWFRVPSFREIHANIREQENYAEQTIGGVRKKQENLEEMLKNIVKSATDNDELSWDQKQIVKDVKETIQAQSDSLQNALKSLEQSVERLKQEGSLGEEITEKMDQIKKSLEELIKQFGDSLLFDMKGEQDISWDEMKDALNNVEKMLPELNERLDNTLEFLAMLKRDREMAALAMRAEKLAQEQSEIGNDKQNSQSAQHQKDLIDRIDNLKKDLANPIENDPISTPSSQSLDSLQKEMSSQLSKQQLPSTGDMNKMSSSLLSLSQELRGMMSSSKMQQMQAERELLLDLAHDALSLADWQKSVLKQLRQQVDATELAKLQQAILEALKKTSTKVDSLKMIPPSLKQDLRKNFSSALKSSDYALKALGEMNGNMAMMQNRNSINELADKLLSVGSMMDQQSQNMGSSGGGLMQGLRKLSGKQGAINAATADLLRSMMKGSQSGGQPKGGSSSAEARSAAQEAQNALAEELKKLADKFGEQAGEGLNRRMEELEKEARKIASMLQNPNEQISERQDRFLSRMLQTTLSLHRQGEGKEERKSSAAETVFTETKVIPPGENFDDPDTFHMLRRKALQGNFPENYRTAIKAYFDSLGVLFLHKK